MSEDWRVGFHRAVIDTIVGKGELIDEDRGFYSIFGWSRPYQDTEDTRRRLSRHGIDYEKSTYKDSYWEEFMGTFVDNETVYGLDAVIVSVRGVQYPWRYSGSMAKLLTGILASDGREDPAVP